MSLPTMNVMNILEQLKGDCVKLRYNNHTMSFRHKKCINDTELSKYLWKLKEQNSDYNLQWSIKAYASPYKCETRKCDLCLTEKMIIAMSDPKKLLNKRTVGLVGF